ncbi:MAG: DUF4271 domain-containing protein [Mediterranea massiliensis]|nr:DUF4271 domain-containing protein [Mediterranea massiliensis]
MKVEILPYTLQMDNAIVFILLLCFLFSSYVLSRSRKFLWQLGQDFIMHRARISLFADSTGGDARSFSMLLLQLCVLMGISCYYFFVSLYDVTWLSIPPLSLCAIYMLLSALYFVLKWLLYLLIGSVFFDKSRVYIWISSYSTLLYYFSFLLFPFSLLLVFLEMGLYWTVALGIFLLLFAKILMFYKGIKLFCGNLYDGLLLFLYFCALEIVPVFVLYRGLMELNGSLIIKN